MLNKSTSVHSIKVKDKLLIYNSLNGSSIISNKDALDLINLFKEPTTIQTLAKTNPELNSYKEILELFESLNFLERKQDALKQKYKTILKKHLVGVENGSEINSLTLVVNEACNFKCSYCMENSMIDLKENRRVEKGKKMSFKTAKLAVDKYLLLLKKHNKNKAEIGFSGGEPFLNWKLMNKVMKYANECIKQYASIKTLEFGFNTNASLITEDIVKQLSKYNITTITIGLDGLENGNNRVRLKNNNTQSYNSIIKGLKLLKSKVKSHFEINTVLTLSNYNEVNLDFLDLIKTLKINCVSIEPNLIDFPKIEIPKLSQRLVDLRNYGKKIGIEVKGFWLLASTRFVNGVSNGKNIPMFHCASQAGCNLTVSSTGQVGICSYISPVFGDLSNLDNILKEKNFKEFIASRFNSNISYCKNCELQGVCDGGCYVSFENGSSLSKRCEFYKDITRALLENRFSD